MGEKRLPFEGVRVCDFTWFAAGPIATKVLADHGAEVIKIESMAHFDRLRFVQPVPDDKAGNLNCGGFFNDFNSSKYSMHLNLAHPKAIDIATRLIMKSDVVVENFSPRVMEKLGLTYEKFAPQRPDLIWVDQPMQGLSGPHKYYAGYGSLITPLGGLAHLTGFPNRPPVGSGTNYTDYVINCGHLFIATAAALRRRKKTGRGQHVVMSQFESAVSILETAILDYTVNGRSQTRNGNRDIQAAPHGAYRCKGERRECVYISARGPKKGTKDDRWCAIAVLTDAHWQAFCRAIGEPSWTKEPRFATLSARKENEDELDRLVEQWTIDRAPEEVMLLMQAAGVPAGVCQDGEDTLILDPHMKARGYYVYLDHPEAGRTAYDGPPFRLSETPGKLRMPAPRMGEHTDFVCKNILGMSEQEINDCIVDQVFE
ncbi:MAG: CoA transferase [Deltaproteobacteria bacterium]|nr:CoA transferase [Deltaproteobacteria bacterium]